MKIGDKISMISRNSNGVSVQDARTFNFLPVEIAV